MAQYQIEVSIFDQESFEEDIAGTIKIIEQTPKLWNYETLVVDTDLSKDDLSKFFDGRFEGQLDWDFVK